VGTEQLKMSMRRAVDLEMAVCEVLNRQCHPRRVKRFFVIVSWLGDGRAWYFLMFTLPLIYGESGRVTSVSMAKIAVVNLVIYKIIKHLTGRQRPCAVSASISLETAPLDQYSFPSGHTMHAVAFSMVATAHHPQLTCLLVPLSALIALSRVILGHHYPTDVIAGGVIGGYVASVLLAW
jgi:undecaprenyl-diphosphatase